MRRGSAQVAVIPGDGIGPEVVGSAVAVLKATGAPLDFASFPAGDACLGEKGVALPPGTLRAARKADAVLFGAVGSSAAEVILRLRRELRTFANVRPTRAFSGVECLHPQTDLVIVRENTECLYIGEERSVPGGVRATRLITAQASKRIAEFAFDLARKSGRKRVTAVHKANVLRKGDGLFLAQTRAVAHRFPEIDYSESLVDSTAMELVMHPQKFDVILTTNMFGDILSDLAAGLVGGLGLCPSANIGRRHAIFEPVHGSAPDIAGKGIADPIAAILSGAMMLDYLGFAEEAEAVVRAVESAIADRATTPDLGGTLTTEEASSEIIARLPLSTSRSVPILQPTHRGRPTPSAVRTIRGCTPTARR